MTRHILAFTTLTLLTAVIGCSESTTSNLQSDTANTSQPPAAVLEASGASSPPEVQANTDSLGVSGNNGVQQKRALPEYITTDIGIGIYRESIPNGIRVTFVSPDSGAFKSGIQTGDVVVSIDDTPLASADAATVDELLAGEVGQKKLLKLKDGRQIRVAVDTFRMSNLGRVPAFNDNQPASPNLQPLHADLRPVADMIVAGKYRAAATVLETLAGTHATNGSFYLVRAIHMAAEHGMLTPDSRNVPDGSSDGKTLIQRILGEIDLAVELDETLHQTAADWMSWLAVRILLSAADNQIGLTYITSEDHNLWELEPLQRYTARGDWIHLLRKARQLSPNALGQHIAGLFVARDRYLKNGDLFSATFLNEVAAYRYCVADPGNSLMLSRQALQFSERSLRYLADYLEKHPNSAMDVAATFHAMCSTSGTNVWNESHATFQQFWKLLQDTSASAASFAARGHVRHRPPMFDRMATPKECFLYHIESFFQEDWDGFAASTLASVLNEIQSPNAFAANFGQNVLAESLMPMIFMSNGMLPEFISNSAQYEPFAVQNQHDVDFYLITIRLNEVQFEREVTMMVPMMAQAKFPTLEQVLNNIASGDRLTAKRNQAGSEGRLNDLVIGVVNKQSDGQLQVLSSPVINLLSQKN